MKTKSRQFEKGQAIAEMTVCMIAIMAVFLGFVVIADLSLYSLRNYLDARETADNEAAWADDQVMYGESIQTWSAGDDGLRYTYDDQVDGGTFENPGLFQGEITTGKNNIGVDIDYQEDLPLSFYGSTMGEFFLDAASLVEGRYSRVLPSDTEYMTTDMLDFIMGQSSITVEDKVYIPSVGE